MKKVSQRQRIKQLQLQVEALGENNKQLTERLHQQDANRCEATAPAYEPPPAAGTMLTKNILVNIMEVDAENQAQTKKLVQELRERLERLLVPPFSSLPEAKRPAAPCLMAGTIATRIRNSEEINNLLVDTLKRLAI